MGFDARTRCAACIGVPDMMSLFAEVFLPKDDGTLSFRDQTIEFVRFLEANEIQGIFELTYQKKTRAYSLQSVDVQGTLSSYLVKKLNVRDFIILLKDEVQLTCEAILDLDFCLLVDRAQNQVLPDDLFTADFERELMTALSSIGGKTACYAFHDFQSLVVWHAKDRLPG